MKFHTARQIYVAPCNMTPLTYTEAISFTVRVVAVGLIHDRILLLTHDRNLGQFYFQDVLRITRIR